jgi:hypothetical protein
MSSMMRMPKICAKCGENPPTNYFEVQEQWSTINSKTFITMFFGRVSTTRHTLTYQVPLCEECHADAVMQKRIGMVMMGLAFLIGGAGIALSVFKVNIMTEVPTIINIATKLNMKPKDLAPAALMALGVLLGVLTVVFVGKPKFASNSGHGRTFRFYNKTFHEAFARLNPDKVKQPRHE